MPKKNGKKYNIEKYEIAGHSVQIRSLEGREELLIDGIRRRFYKTERGYNLFDDAYTPPKESLLEAIKAYFESTSEEEQKD